MQYVRNLTGMKLLSPNMFEKMFTPGDDEGRKRFLQSVGACLRQLRLLNALREARIGIPLTPPQLSYLGEDVLIARLARRRMYVCCVSSLSNHKYISCRTY